MILWKIMQLKSGIPGLLREDFVVKEDKEKYQIMEHMTLGKKLKII